MAWNAQGQWIPDTPTAAPSTNLSATGAAAPAAAAAPTGAAATPANVQTMAAPAETAPVTQQTQQLSGLLGNVSNATANAATGTPPTSATTGQATIPAPTQPPVTTTPVPQDASVANQLTGLLGANSPYMEQARQAGMRIANKRGLLNSSIAAGNSEAAAIAAAAPIASQDASQIQQRNQSILEGDINYRNATGLQTQQDAAAMERLNSELGNRITLQNLGDASAMERLLQQGDIEVALQQLRNSNDLSQTTINANVSLLSNYMNAFATLSSNPELPATARDAYMREFLRVTQSGQALVNALGGIQVTWPTTPTPTTPTPTTTTGSGGNLLNR